MRNDPLNKFRCYGWTSQDTQMNCEFISLLHEFREEKRLSKAECEDILITLYKRSMVDKIFSLTTDAMTAHLAILHRSLIASINKTDRQVLYDAVRNIWRHITDLDISRYNEYTSAEDKVKMIKESSKEYIEWYLVHSAYQKSLIRITEADLYFPVYLRLANDVELAILCKYLDVMTDDKRKMDNIQLGYILSIISKTL